MIESRRKNQSIVLAVVDAYVKKNPRVTQQELMDFVRLLIGALLIRVADNDCYFIDMLEDIGLIKDDSER